MAQTLSFDEVGLDKQTMNLLIKNWLGEEAVHAGVESCILIVELRVGGNATNDWLLFPGVATFGQELSYGLGSCWTIANRHAVVH